MDVSSHQHKVRYVSPLQLPVGAALRLITKG